MTTILATGLIAAAALLALTSLWHSLSNLVLAAPGLRGTALAITPLREVRYSIRSIDVASTSAVVLRPDFRRSAQGRVLRAAA